MRKRPKKTSTNAKIVRAVFGDEPRKLLYIPLAIDAYNHHMNGADIANQRRKYITTQRKHNIRSWRPLFHWLLDLTIVNCYILWREQARKKNPKVYWDPNDFTKALAGSLFTSCHDIPIDAPPRHISPRKLAGSLPVGISKAVAAVTDIRAIDFARQHHFTKLPKDKRKHCTMCKELGFKPGELLGAHPSHINANSRGRWKGTRTRGMCLQCNLAFCTEGSCFELYHERLR